MHQKKRGSLKLTNFELFLLEKTKNPTMYEEYTALWEELKASKNRDVRIRVVRNRVKRGSPVLQYMRSAITTFKL